MSTNEEITPANPIRSIRCRESIGRVPRPDRHDSRSAAANRIACQSTVRGRSDRSVLAALPQTVGHEQQPQTGQCVRPSSRGLANAARKSHADRPRSRVPGPRAARRWPLAVPQSARPRSIQTPSCPAPAPTPPRRGSRSWRFSVRGTTTSTAAIAWSSMMGSNFSSARSKRTANSSRTDGRPTGELTRFYSHGIATLALSEAFGMTGDERLRDPAQRALDYLAGTHRNVPGALALSARPRCRLIHDRLATGDAPQRAARRIERRAANDRRSSAPTWPGAAKKSRRQANAPSTPRSDSPWNSTWAVRRATSGCGPPPTNCSPIRPSSEMRRIRTAVAPPPDNLRRDTYYWYYGSEAMYLSGRRRLARLVAATLSAADPIADLQTARSPAAGIRAHRRAECTPPPAAGST